jgi:hypothetical protein
LQVNRVPDLSLDLREFRYVALVVPGAGRQALAGKLAQMMNGLTKRTCMDSSANENEFSIYLVDLGWR